MNRRRWSAEEVTDPAASLRKILMYFHPSQGEKYRWEAYDLLMALGDYLSSAKAQMPDGTLVVAELVAEGYCEAGYLQPPTAEAASTAPD